MVEDCIFCKIASGEVPVPFIYEDDLVVAFMDAEPQAPVHVLVIPRQHFRTLGDGVPPEVGAALCAAVPRVAEITEIAEEGYRVIVNSGPNARQSVPHLHVHVLGGAQMTHGMVNFG
jgi:histidine triad (HIT) family protein